MSNKEKTKKKILVIDDSCKIWKDLFVNNFKDEDYEFAYSPDGKKLEDGTDVVLSNYELVVLDFYLKDKKTGVEWAKENIKKIDPYLPIIFWTSSLDSKVLKESTIGEDIFFKKDLHLPSFKAAIDKHIYKRRQYKKYHLYNDFFNSRIVSDTNRERCHKIYVETSKYLESFFAFSKYHAVFNAHGFIHSQNVLHNLARLFYPIANEFSEEEYVIAYIAAAIHDLGLMPVKFNENMESADFRRIRSNHCRTIFWWVYSGQLEKYFGFELTPEQWGCISLIVLFHDGNYDFGKFPNPDKVKDDLGKNFNELPNLVEDTEKKNLSDFDTLLNRINSYQIKVKLLASLVALADKLDYGPSRVPISVLRKAHTEA